MKKTIFLVILLFFIKSVFATPTKLTVRVKAKDAKFIGTGIGGALITIKNNLTGELLAKGVTAGASGDTKLLLQTPIERNHPVSDDKTAKFIANIDITEPTLVDIEVIAPVNRRGSAIKGATQYWLIPGKDVLGDGLIIELPGLILDILSPTTHQIISLDSVKDNILNLKISLTMLCGCPITKGTGVWNSNDFEVTAIVKKEGIEMGRYDLDKSAETNLFDGKIKIKEKGNYEILIYGFNAKDNNSGVDKINFVVQ